MEGEEEDILYRQAFQGTAGGSLGRDFPFFFFKMGNSCISMLKRDCQWRQHDTSWHYCLNKSFVKEGVVL